MLADYLPWCNTAVIPDPPPATPTCRDPFDLPFLQLAVAGKARCLVTGGQDWLSMDGKIGCPIITAERFIQTFNAPPW